jgi:subtilisin family serine protease
LACLLLPAVVHASPSGLPIAGQGGGAYVPGEALVSFEPGATANERQRARAAAGVELEEPAQLPRTQLVTTSEPVGAAVDRLERQPGVAYAQPNYRYETTAVTEPDDSFFGELWGLSDPALPEPGLGALNAWESTRGAGETIAVLDTGVDLTHPDLASNLWANVAEEGGVKGVDDDLDGKVDDIHGYDFVDNDGNPDDYNFHGTHVAGTAAAVADNALGIAGVAPQAQIMAVRVLDGDGSGNTLEIAEGIDYAADHGADVINMSLGGPAGAGDKAMADAIGAAGAKGVVVVVAAGNEAADNEVEPESPCVLPQANLICVAALNKSGALAGFSNYGAKSVDLAAPGTSILSSKPDYGPPVFEDGFEVTPSPWVTAASGGGKPWGLTEPGASGEFAATDSPGGNYGHAEPGAEEPAASELFTEDPVSLAGERGCRMHFNSKYEIEAGFDVFLAGGISDASAFDVAAFDGTSFGYPSTFFREEASVSELDGRSDVHPFFGVFSDEEVELDGAYVDDVRLFCRDETYTDAIATGSNYDLPASGSYVRFQGTSMATPHVAGEVALVKAAAPSLDAEDVVQAVLDGTSAMPVTTPGKRTVTEGIADACKAIAIATGANVATECPASSEPVPQPPLPITATEEAIVDASPPATPESLEQVLRRRVPQTFIRRHPAKLVRVVGDIARVIFRFAADESGATFLCRLDKESFHPCRARIVRRLGLGAHVVRVKARDADGNVDPTPAVFRFRVERVG